MLQRETYYKDALTQCYVKVLMECNAGKDSIVVVAPVKEFTKTIPNYYISLTIATKQIATETEQEFFRQNPYLDFFIKGKVTSNVRYRPLGRLTLTELRLKVELGI